MKSDRDIERDLKEELGWSPDLDASDIAVSVSIRGDKKVETKEEDKNKNYRAAERGYGVFFRAIQLPAGVDPAGIQAAMSKGVLNVEISKPAKSEPKKIEVKEPA